MAAAVAAALFSRDRTRMSSDKLSNNLYPKEDSEQHQVSFHLKQLFGEELNIGSHSSAQYLRLPFVSYDLDSHLQTEPWKTSKINFAPKFKQKTSPSIILEVWVEKLALHSDADTLNELIWQPRLLVLANRGLFILRRVDNELEIVDSIPLHEIDAIKSISGVGACLRSPRIASMKKAASASTTSFLYEDNNHINDKNQRLMDKYDRVLANPDRTFSCLRITTTPEGFNDGRPYYFRFGSDFDDSNPDKEPILTFAGRIEELSDAQKQSVAFRVRFRRFQAALQRVWQSVPFNMLVLFLIVSNFFFTVRGMENTDPDSDAFFEWVDMIYTILFTLGARPHPSAPCKHPRCTSILQPAGRASIRRPTGRAIIRRPTGRAIIRRPTGRASIRRPVCPANRCCAHCSPWRAGVPGRARAD
jgi:hypothetical protein